MKRQAIIFDLYGTLIDIQTDEYDPGVWSALSRYLSYHLIRIKPDDLRKVYNDEVRFVLAKSSQPYPEVDVFNVFKSIMDRYGSKNNTISVVKDAIMLFRSLTIRRFRAFDGIYDVLNYLIKDYKMAIVSDAQWVFTDPEMEMLGLNRFFKYKVLSSKFGIKKPDTRLFQIAMKKLRVKPEDAIYIGDRPDKDLIGAKRAGMKCLLFSSVEISLNGIKPDRQFDNYSQLQKIINEITA